MSDSNENSHINSRHNLTNNHMHQNSKQMNGIGQKAIAGLMIPNSTAQSYAAIAHAAAAAAQSNQQRNLSSIGNDQMNSNNNNSNNIFHSNSNNNILCNNKSQSYNNPGFFESTSYPIVNSALINYICIFLKI
jgi:hypothetical protein